MVQVSNKKFKEMQARLADLEEFRKRFRGAPPLKKRDHRDMMIIWSIEEYVRKGHSVYRAVDLFHNSKNYKKLIEKYPNPRSKDQGKSHIRHIYNEFKSQHYPQEVFEGYGNHLVMKPTNEWTPK